MHTKIHVIDGNFKCFFFQDESQPAMITPLRRESQSSTSSETQETAQAVATLQVVSAASLQPVSHTETVIATAALSPSPPASPRLPSILEAAIKAEPKVEVERLPSPSGTSGDELMPQSRYVKILRFAKSIVMLTDFS